MNEETNNQKQFDMSRFFTGKIDLSGVDPEYAFTKENFVRFGLASQKETFEAMLTLYKERTNQGKVLEKLDKIGRKIDKHAQTTESKIEETSSIIAEKVSGVGNNIISAVIEGKNEILDKIENTSEESTNKIIQEIAEGRFNQSTGHEYINNTLRDMRSDIYNLGMQVKDGFSDAGRDRVLKQLELVESNNNLRNLLKAGLGDVNKKLNNLGTGITEAKQEIIGSIHETGYGLLDKSISLNEQTNQLLEEHDKTTKKQLNRVYEAANPYTSPLHAAASSIGYANRDDLIEYLGELRDKINPDKLKKDEDENIDLKFYATLFMEGKRRCFSKDEILNYLNVEPTRLLGIKTVLNNMSDWVYEKRNK